MNIFATDDDPVIAAQHHCDVHLVKMPIEVCQLLSTCHYVMTGVQVGYKPTHTNHPSGKWLRESKANYEWAYRFYCALLDEYQFRFNRIHGSTKHRAALGVTPHSLPDVPRTKFAMAMPEEFKSDNPVLSYQAYLHDKLLEWRNRERPMRTCFTNREVPKHLKGVSIRILIPVNLGITYGEHHEPSEHLVFARERVPESRQRFGDWVRSKPRRIRTATIFYRPNASIADKSRRHFDDDGRQ